MDLELELRWRLKRDTQSFAIDDLLFGLLEDIDAAGNLRSAANKQAVSYRHAWGLIRTWEERFGAALIESQRGRGASLTAYSRSLLTAHHSAVRELNPTLEKQALRVAAALESARDHKQRRIRISSSHNEQVLALRDSLLAEGRDVSLDVVGSEGALRSLRRGDADMAGFHLPMGALGRSVAAKLIALLDDKHDEIILIEKRQLGLMSRSDHNCTSVEDLWRSRFRFINRQPGSATRLTFDGLLGTAGIAPGEINGYHDEEYTHSAVAARVSSKDADVAFGSESAARHFLLRFEPLVEERFYLCLSQGFDHAARQYISDHCASIEFAGASSMKSDEFRPSVAVLKRVHNAGFWK